MAMFSIILAKRAQSFSPTTSSSPVALARGIPSFFHKLQTQPQRIQSIFQFDSSSSPSWKRRYLSSSLSMGAMNSSMQKQQQQEQITSIYGGDYAGQSATFSPITGKLIPVPEHYVPDSMIEWGQIPSCLEVIVSEDIIPNDDDGGTGNDCSMSLSRNTVQVMPEVGCGLDNLDTMKLKENIPLNLEEGSSSSIELEVKNDGNDNVDVYKVASSTTYVQEKSKHRVECIFTTPAPATATATATLENGDNSSQHQQSRIRIGVNFFPNKMELKSPIDIVKERKTSNSSSKGTIADGGGLDARTVTRLIGKDNSNRPLCEKNDEINYEKVIVGSWNVIACNNSSKDDNNVAENTVVVVDRHGDSSANDKETKTITTLSLPGNVIVQYGGSPFTLEISFVVNQLGDNNNENVKQPIRRLVMKREFHKNDSDTISSNAFTSYVNYSWEEKVI